MATFNIRPFGSVASIRATVSTIISADLVYKVEDTMLF